MRVTLWSIFISDLWLYVILLGPIIIIIYYVYFSFLQQRKCQCIKKIDVRPCCLFGFWILFLPTKEADHIVTQVFNGCKFTSLYSQSPSNLLKYLRSQLELFFSSSPLGWALSGLSGQRPWQLPRTRHGSKTRTLQRRQQTPNPGGIKKPPKS